MNHSGTEPQPAALLSPSPQRAPRTRLESLAEILFALLVAAGLAVVLIEGAINVGVPYQLEFGEGNVLASSLMVAHGQSAYPPLTAQPPYVFSPYGPLLYWIEAPLVRWFGVGFGAGRLLSLLATLASAVLLTLLLRRWTGSWRTALLFGGLYLSLPQVGFWATTMRADPLAVALSLAGLYSFAVNIRRWPIAALLFVAAILVKPTLVAAPAAVFLYLLVLRRDARAERKMALGFGALVGGLILVAFATMQHATGGAFAFHLFGSHPEPYLLRHYVGNVVFVGVQQLIPTVMALAFVMLALRRGVIRNPTTLPLLYIAMALLATLSAGTAGASSNHFLDWSAAVCVGAGMAYHLAEENPHPLARGLRSTALLAMVACALLFSSLAWLVWNSPEGTEPGPVRRFAVALPYQQRIFPIDTEVPRDCIELQDYLASLPDRPIISENTGAALFAGKTLLVTDPYTYGQLVLAGKLPPAPLEQMLRDHRVGAVVLAQDVARLRTAETNRWPSSFLDAVEQNYRWERDFKCKDGRAVYLPRAAR